MSFEAVIRSKLGLWLALSCFRALFSEGRVGIMGLEGSSEVKNEHLRR